jgi:hypothetical protein
MCSLCSGRNPPPSLFPAPRPQPCHSHARPERARASGPACSSGGAGGGGAAPRARGDGGGFLWGLSTNPARKQSSPGGGACLVHGACRGLACVLCCCSPQAAPACLSVCGGDRPSESDDSGGALAPCPARGPSLLAVSALQPLPGPCCCACRCFHDADHPTQQHPHPQQPDLCRTGAGARAPASRRQRQRGALHDPPHPKCRVLLRPGHWEGCLSHALSTHTAPSNLQTPAQLKRSHVV